MHSHIKKFITFFVIALFYGCSGHTLQDLVDDNSQNKSSNAATAEAQADKFPSPSNNSALQSISPSTTASDDHEEYRYMQKSTNEWIENEWNPLTENNLSDEKNSNTDDNNKHKIMKIDTNESQLDDNSSVMPLQHYVDKAGIYIENKEKRDANKTEKSSHSEMIETLPGIGTKSKR